MEPVTNEVQIDPVCGMEVEPETAAGSFEHEGTTYHFCSLGCLEDFREDPASFLGPSPPLPGPV